MEKPSKPEITLPQAFAVNGRKEDFEEEKLQNGFDPINPDVLAGDNLNKFIDDTYKGLNYSMAIADAVNSIAENQVLSVQDGEFVSVPLDSSSGGGSGGLLDKITNCILENNGASITPTDYTQQAYVNKDCTISETNVVSGFSATSYIILNKTFTNSSSFTFTIPFTLTATTGVQPIVAINDTANSLAVVNGVLRFNYMGETLTGTTTLAASTAYTVQFIRTDNGYTVQIKAAADEDYTQEINLPSSLDYFSGKTVYLGSDRVNALNGTIDLANVTIQADNATFWDINTLLDFQTVTLSGSLDTLMPNGRKEDLTLNNLEQTVTLDTTLLLNNATSNTKTILVKDNNEVMIRDSYTESSDEPSDSVSGAIWLDTDANQMKEQQVVLPNLLNSGCSFYDGVASNFSQAGYLSLPSEYNLGTDWSISLPVNIQKNADSDMNVILGDLTEEGSSVIPDSVAVVYDGDETVTAYLRREDVYDVTKQVVTSTAYKVTKGEAIGYVSVEGSSGTYVPADTQVYSDSIMSAPYEVAAANTWTYTGDSVENTATQNGYVRESGSVFVASGVQVYTTADLTTPLETASGSDWVYTGATSPSMIGALNETVEAQNYTVVGSPTINNGVVSGFSTGSYITIPAFKPGTQQWEIVESFTTGTLPTGMQMLFNADGAVAFNINNSHFRLSLSSSGSDWDIYNNESLDYTVLPNTTYWVKVAYTGSSYTLAYATTENNYTTLITVDNATPVNNSSPATYYGVIHSTSGIENPFQGSIDLNDSYIKINGETFWSYQSGDTTLNLSYNGSQYSLGSQTLASSDVVKSGWQPTIGSAPSTADAYFNSTIDIGNADFSFWTWNGISDIKPNINIIGNLNFNNGVLSGFGSGNVAQLPTAFNPGTNPWEMRFKVTTGAINGSSQTIIRCVSPSGAANDVLVLRIEASSNKWALWLSSNGSSWDISSSNFSSATVSANTIYWLKLSFNGSAYTLASSSTGAKDSYTTIITANSSSAIATSVRTAIGAKRPLDNNTAEFFLGSIDLNESYININGQMWWKWNGVTVAGYSWQTFPAAKIGEVAMRQETVQPNIRIDGTLTNNNGVFSGFSTANNIYCSEFQLNGDEHITLQEHFVTPSTFTNNSDSCHLGLGTEDFKLFDCVIGADAKPAIYVSSNGIDWNVANNVKSTLTLNPSTAYYGRVRYDGANIYQEYSTNGRDYTIYNTITLPSFAAGTYYKDLGVWEYSQGTSWYWAGAQNLTGCKVYINDVLSFSWNGYTQPTQVNKYASATLDYPVELVKKEDYVSLLDMVYPIGFPMPSLDGVLRSGEIWLEGAAVSRSTYASLFKVYGTTYGAGNGSTTFQLPDIRNRVLWGSGDGNYGYINAGLPYIGYIKLGQIDYSSSGGGAFVRNFSAGSFNTGDGGSRSSWGNFDVGGNGYNGYGTSSTVQPPSVKVRWKTRYK